MILDRETLGVAVAVAGGACALGMMMNTARSRKYPGTRLWSEGYGVVFMGVLAYALASLIGDVTARFIASSLLVAGMVRVSQGTSRFSEQDIQDMVFYGLIGGHTLLQLVVALMGKSNISFFFEALVLALLFTMQAFWISSKSVCKSARFRLFARFFLNTAAVLFLASAVLMTVTALQDWHEFINTLSNLLMMIMLIVSMAVYMQLISCKLDAEIRIAHDEIKEEQLQNEVLQKQLEKNISKDAQTDITFGLSAIEDIQQIFDSTRTNNLHMSMIWFDIDDLKSVNVKAGYETGDRVIRAVADVVRDVKREDDLFCHFGKGDFLVVMPNANLETAKKHAERMRELVAAMPLFSGKERFRVTGTFGVATRSNRDTSYEDVLERAKSALEDGKQKGKNTVSAGKSTSQED